MTPESSGDRSSLTGKSNNNEQSTRPPGRPTWTLITVAYNSEAPLSRCWASPIPDGIEWIVVDNNSTDRSVEVARAAGAIVLQESSNTGFGAACNRGFRAAKGEYVAFVNPDVLVDYGSLPELAASIDREDGLVAPQLVYPDNSLQPGARGVPSLTNKTLSRLGRRSVTARYHLFAEPNTEIYASWLIGAAVAGRRTTLAELGPWDEAFFVYYEDSDLGLRAWESGLTVRVVGTDRWVHEWARETTSMRPRAWANEFRSMIRFYARYPGLVFGDGQASRLRRQHRSTWGSPVRRELPQQGIATHP